MRRTKEDAAVTRQKVLQAALTVFSEKGYTASKLDDVAKAANVTRGAIYWHFKDKADLFNTLVREVGLRRDEVIHHVVAQGGSFLDIFRRILIHLIQDVEEHRDIRAIMGLSLFKVDQLPELAEGHAVRRDANRALIDNMAAFLQMGIESGEVRANLDPHDAARAAVAFQQGIATLWLYDPSAFSLIDRAPALADVYMQGIMAH
jgi:TetR/AcrR family acrAB operon transcriptional repressor